MPASDAEINEIAGLTAPLPTTVPLTDAAHQPIGEARLSTNEAGDVVMDATVRDSLGWCADCPDHEACATGATCARVKAIFDRATPAPSADPFPPTAGQDESAQISEIALEAVEVRRGSWLDRVMNRSHTDRFLQALVAQGWTLVPWWTDPEDTPWGHFAYPPGVEPGGRPCVPVPDTIEPGRAEANLVAALRLAGPFRPEGQ